MSFKAKVYPEKSAAVQTDSVGNSVDLRRVRSTLPSISRCDWPRDCVTIENIMETLQVPLDEETSWALLYQIIMLLKTYKNSEQMFSQFEVPEEMRNVSLHRDGSIHWNWSDDDLKQQGSSSSNISSQSALQKVGVIIFNALNKTLLEDEEITFSDSMQKVLEFICFGTIACQDEFNKFKDSAAPPFEYALNLCRKRVNYTTPEMHYTLMITSLYKDAHNVKNRHEVKEGEVASPEEVIFEANEFENLQKVLKGFSKIRNEVNMTLNHNNWNKAYEAVVNQLEIKMKSKSPSKNIPEES